MRRAADSLLRLAQSRLDLFAVELQEEKWRLIQVLLWVGVALVLTAAGVTLILGALALWLWKTAGYLGLVIVALLALGSAAGILIWLRRRLRAEGPPFRATVAEFQKDRAWLFKSDKS